MKFSAVLLTGGKSSRMGRDKASLPYQGRMLWEHQIDILQQAGADEVLISGNSHGPYDRSTYAIIPDEYTDCGPIAGLHSALKKAKNEQVLLLAIDLPHMASDYLRYLWSKCRPGCGAVGLDEAYEPLAAFYPRSILPLIESHIRNGIYSFQKLIAEAESQGCMVSYPIAPNNQHFFFNWNSGSI